MGRRTSTTVDAPAPGDTTERSSAVDHIRHATDTLFRVGAGRRTYAQHTAASGVTLSRPAYILLLRVQSETLSMGDLARLAHMDAGATARKVAHLEREGYVQRAPSAQDRRVILVSATPKGKKVANRIARTLTSHLSEALAEWSDVDLARFASLFSRFVSDLGSKESQVPEGDHSARQMSAVLDLGHMHS